MITDEIINVKFLNENLIKIIPSIIVLDQDFQIKSISSDVAKLLYYRPEELRGCDIIEIFKPAEYSFHSSIDELKTKGYFETRKITLLNRYDKEVSAEISGFYLGLLSDAGNSIVLNVRDMDKLQTYQTLLNDKVTEFNELVYRTYHDLRGPVATIQGLLNISKYNNDDDDHKKTFQLIDQSTHILNARLTNISAIFDSNYLTNSNPEDSNLNALEISACKLINSQFPKTNVTFKMVVNDFASNSIDNELLTSIVTNLIQSLDNCNICANTPSIIVDLRSFQDIIQIKADITGFCLDFSRYEKILNHEFNFADIINDENLLRVYVLNNHVQKYNGNIYSNISDEINWSITILIPN